ncbi:MAG: hypothetical protein ACOYEF_13170 [Planifilum sp.]
MRRNRRERPSLQKAFPHRPAGCPRTVVPPSKGPVKGARRFTKAELSPQKGWLLWDVLFGVRARLMDSMACNIDRLLVDS